MQKLCRIITLKIPVISNGLVVLKIEITINCEKYYILLCNSCNLCKTPPFAQFLRLPCGMRSLFLWGQAQILILEILYVFLPAPPAP